MQNNKIGSGLHNLGNTCFFNAVMQVILYTPSLHTVFNNKMHSSACSKEGWCIFCAIESLWHDSKRSRVVSPNAIVANLRIIFKKFRLGRQQDSHEFLRYLIEGMQDAQTGKLGKDREKNELIICKTRSYRTFGGKMRTFVLCLSCHHKSLTTERYYDLSIQCQRSNSLQEGLDSYFKVDELSGANKYRCDNCKQLSNAKKGFRILSIPSIVTFQFKRFTNSLRKIGKYIEYPRVLNLNRYMEHDMEPQTTKLELYGVIVHAGSSAGSGHYFAFVRNGQEWYQMNDSNVSRCSEERALRQQAYLLFYAKTKADKPEQMQMVEQNPEIMTNIRNGTNELKISTDQNHKTEEKQKKKQIGNKKTIQMKPVRKQSQQQFQETKRKLSLDIEQLKQQARVEQSKSVGKQPNGKISNQNKIKSLKIEINGKTIEAPSFGQKEELVQQNNFKNQQKEVAQDNDDDLDLDLLVPQKLERRRSKEQALSGMSMMEMVLHYASQIDHLQQKIPRRSHRALRSVYNLRKLEISSKRRKLNSD